jgi:RNA polymerase subunit RPABC4/transcription elongation factor Spt4
VFLDFNVTPLKGDTDTEFIFSARVLDPDGDGIEYVRVNIDGDVFGMGRLEEPDAAGSNHSRFQEKLKLDKGDHTVYFEAEDLDGNRSDTSENSISISVSKAEEESNFNRYFCLVGVILFTLVLMFWTFSQFRKRKRMQEAEWDAEEEDEGNVKCTNCNKPVPGDVDECPHCHEPFEGIEEVCPFCETKVPKGATKCPLCKKRFKGFKKKGAPKGRLSCPKCGAVVDKDMKTCPGCDSDLKQIMKLKTKKGKAAEKKKDVYMCSMCGADVKEGDDVCGKCGVRFG